MVSVTFEIPTGKEGRLKCRAELEAMIQNSWVDTKVLKFTNKVGDSVDPSICDPKNISVGIVWLLGCLVLKVC